MTSWFPVGTQLALTNLVRNDALNGQLVPSRYPVGTGKQMAGFTLYMDQLVSSWHRHGGTLDLDLVIFQI